MTLFHRKMGEGKPLIILHGLFGSSDNWISIAKLLENDFEIFLIDQRNHGQSPHSDAFDYDAMAADLAEFIEQHRIKNPVVIGHSMGGKTVMEFVFQYTELPAGLIVVDIAPRHYPVHHQTILEGLNAINLASIQSRKEADSILQGYIAEVGIRQFLLKNLQRNSKTGAFQWKINLPIITEKIENVGEEIRSRRPFDKPTLFLGGANSEYIRAQDHTDIRTLFPKARIEMIPNAGHWVHAEQPQAFVEAVRSFLASF